MYFRDTFLDIICIDFGVVLESMLEPKWTLLGAGKRLGTESVTLRKSLFCLSETYVFEIIRAQKRIKIESESDARGECDFDAFSRSDSSRF